MRERKLTNEQLAGMLYDAAKSFEAMDVISDLEPEVNLEDAYSIQLMNECKQGIEGRRNCIRQKNRTYI